MRRSWSPEKPELLPTLVCYMDILGFKEMTQASLRRNKGTDFLREIKEVLGQAYEDVRRFASIGGAQPPLFDMKVFTDNVVVAHPLANPHHDFGEGELGTILMLFAHVQARLTSGGFLVRGAITAGMHYQDDDIAFGDALLEAVELDKSGGAPRLVIGDSVEPLIAKHLSWYGGQNAPHHHHLLEDRSDGRLFVNYLSVAFEQFPDGPLDVELVRGHRAVVERGLRQYRGRGKVRSKYAWVGTYHNFACETFAARYPDRGPESDEQYAAETYEAQKVLTLTIENGRVREGLAPRPLDAGRLRKRLKAKHRGRRK